MTTDHLHKYRSLNTVADFERLYASLFEGKFFASNAAAFNDPFDCSPHFDVTATDEELITHYRKSLRHFAHLGEDVLQKNAGAWLRAFRAGDPDLMSTVDSAINQFRTSLATRWGVFSVAKRWDCELMWGHYASSHTGVCLELAVRALQPDVQFFPVVYQEDRPRLNILTESPETGDVNDMIARSLMTKSKAWQYELEWRHLRPGNVGGFTVPVEGVSAITLGARITPSIATSLIAAIRSRRPTMKIFQAAISSERFEVVRRLVE